MIELCEAAANVIRATSPCEHHFDRFHTHTNSLLELKTKLEVVEGKLRDLGLIVDTLPRPRDELRDS